MSEAREVRPGVVRGRLRVPPSKSVSHRQLALALLARAPVEVRHLLRAEDTELFLGVLRRLGWTAEERGESVHLVPGIPPRAATLACGNAGTLLRFLVGLVATVPGEWTLDGSPRLRERPVGPLVEALRALGVEVRWRGVEGYPPLLVVGGTLRGGETTIDAGESSQYLSALLLAALAAREPTQVRVAALASAPYVDVTLEAIAQWGGRVERRGEELLISPGLSPRESVEVEGDFSAAAYPAAAAALTGGEVTLLGLRSGSVQGDRGFLDLLRTMGAEVAWDGDELRVRGSGALDGVDVDLGGMPDQVPTLAALAPFARGTTRIRNVSHLRIKESDRLAAMARELRRAGAEVKELVDGLAIPGVWAQAIDVVARGAGDAAPALPREEVEIESHGDHRIAMSMALVGLRRAGLRIAAPDVVAKSYPRFWDDLAKLLHEESPASRARPGAVSTATAALEPRREAGRLLHPALAPPQGPRLGDSQLNDRQRIAVLLQAAALLSHLRRAGWRLVGDLAGATVRDDGMLGGVTAEPGGTDDWGVPLRAAFGALFRQGGEVGRGAGRRAARELRDAWAGELVSLHPDHAVAEVLAAAPFLWEPSFAAARRALAAGWAADEGVEPWLAGPDWATRPMLAKVKSVAELQELLADDEARALWGERRSRRRRSTPPLGDGARASVAAPPPSPAAVAADPLAVARSLLAVGRYDEALERVAGDDSAAARLIAAWSLHYLGRAGASRRVVAQLVAERLDVAEELALADLAVRLTLEEGDIEDARAWVERASKAAGAEHAWRAALLAGAVAAVAQDLTALDEAMERSSAAVGDERHAWRWYRLQALRAALAAGPDAAAGPIEALRRCRRVVGPADAALLWDDVAMARLRHGDLVGAERAAAHAVRLLRNGGGRQRRRAVRRLVEARLRRGRVAGVEAALEQIRAEARLADGARGRSPALADAAPRVRMELLRGRPSAAFQIAEVALPAVAGSMRAELAILAARALGWLGRAEEARQLLAEYWADAERVLEREELPALWAHAGDRERAAAAADGPLQHLWKAVLAGSHPSRGRWADLEALESYRAARLVLDFERVTPGLVPAPRVRRAIATLRRHGAAELAAQLEGRLTGPWDALSAHLTESTHDEDGLFRLFAAAGAERAYLAMRTRAGDQVLLPGPGGDEELVAPLGDGHLVLRAPRLDPIVKTLFRLLLNQLPAMRAATAGQSVPGIVGESPALLAALARLPRLAQGEVPIIVLGESGTGKELVARQVHRLSPRANGPFLPINCAALSESLLLEDLFGHAKGAFTGADRDRAGIFETARGGTVFLDEIGDLPLAAQGKLLRVLQEKEVRRLGEATPRTVDVRVVAATHRNLAEMVRDKSFREDLYYRLRVAVVELPPLRERGGDVVLLAEHFLARICRGRRPCRLARSAREQLLAYRWPGNVRELENVLEVAAALAEGGTIEREHLQLPDSRPAPAGTYHQQVETFRRRLVEEALRAGAGNRAEAARRLGLTRQALSYLVRQLRIVE